MVLAYSDCIRCSAAVTVAVIYEEEINKIQSVRIGKARNE